MHDPKIPEKAASEAPWQLAAAAPELLAALRRAVEVIHILHDMTTAGLSEAERAMSWRIYSTHSTEMQAINAAIAKAEGR